MCIFARPVITVNNTQIFARATAAKTQFIAYQMNYESVADNAMILPVPVRTAASETSLRFVDLRGYEQFFDDLNKGFPYEPPALRIGCSAPFDITSDRLQVFQVGNYIASFVPTLSDFSRLDPRFTLPASTWSQVPQYADYGFAVFQLAPGALKPHPMAFEFDSKSDSLYFPTMHIHDGEIHEREEFDHVLYLQHAGFDSRVYGYQNSDACDESTGLIRSKFLARDFCDIERAAGVVDGDLLVHRLIVQGLALNQDTTIATAGDPTKPTLNLRPLLPYTPWLVVAGAVTWFFSRRSKIKRPNPRATGEPWQV